MQDKNKEIDGKVMPPKENVTESKIKKHIKPKETDKAAVAASENVVRDKVRAPNPKKEIDKVAAPLVENSTESKDKKPDRPARPRVEWDKLQVTLAASTKPEEKIRHVLDFMSSSISQKGAPAFKDFWDAKKLCLDFFKESIHPIIRDTLWKEYVELSKEAHNLKEILNEQSSFLTEQFTIAVDALEKEVSEKEKLVAGLKNIPLNLEGTVLNKKKEIYLELQKQAIILEALATRISTLRKEVLKADVRIRFKNKFLEQLTALADKVYPEKKLVLQKISQEILLDVADFKKRFEAQTEWNSAAFKSARLEVQSLQKAAKELSLTPSAFMELRTSLGGCWDKMVEKEKEKREEFQHKKESWDKSFEEARAKIEDLRTKVGTKEFSTLKQQMLDYLAKANLGRDGVTKLKDELEGIESELANKGKIQQLQRKKDQKEVVHQLEKNCAELIKIAKDLSYEDLLEKGAQLLASIAKIGEDNLELLGFKISLEEILFNKKEKDLSSEKLNVDELEDLLGEREESRVEIKRQIEKFRKMLGGSGLSFEKSIRVRELIEVEKRRLDNIENSIEKIADRIVNPK